MSVIHPQALPEDFIEIDHRTAEGTRRTWIRLSAIQSIRRAPNERDYRLEVGYITYVVAVLPVELQWADKTIPVPVPGGGWIMHHVASPGSDPYERGMGDLPVGSLVADVTRPYVIHARLEDGWAEIPRQVIKGAGLSGGGIFEHQPRPIEQYEFILAGGEILRRGASPIPSNPSTTN